MICHTDSKHGGDENARPWVIFVDLLNVECVDDVYDSLMNYFYDRIRMWVPVCNRISLKSVV